MSMTANPRPPKLENSARAWIRDKESNLVFYKLRCIALSGASIRVLAMGCSNEDGELDLPCADGRFAWGNIACGICTGRRGAPVAATGKPGEEPARLATACLGSCAGRCGSATCPVGGAFAGA